MLGRDVANAASIAGIRSVLFHVISDDAKRFYEKAGFSASPVDLMTMMIALADVEEAKRASAYFRRSPTRSRAERWSTRQCRYACDSRSIDRAQAWLTAKFSRLLELRHAIQESLNYPIEVFTEWRGKVFYINVRYRARSRKVEDDFVVRHTRLTLTGFGRFDLAYFRHTDKWFTVYRGLTAADCIREIEENEIFWPTT